MATPQDNSKLREVESLMKSINSLQLQMTGKELFDLNNINKAVSEFNDIDDAIDGLNDKLNKLNIEFSESNDEILTMSLNFKQMVKSSGDLKTLNTAINTTMGQMSSNAEQLKKHVYGINELSSKELKSSRDKFISDNALLNSLKERLSTSIESTKNDIIDYNNKLKSNNLSKSERIAMQSIVRDLESQLKKSKSILESKEELFETSNAYIRNLDIEIDKSEIIERKMGAIGGILKGLAKIPIIGDTLDLSKISSSMENVFKSGGSSIKALGVGISEIGGQLTKALSPLNLIVLGTTALISIMSSIDANAGKFAKDMNVSYSRAVSIRSEMSNIAMSTNDISVNSERLLNSQMEISKSLGTNAMLNTKDLVTLTKLSSKAGLTVDEMSSMQELSLITGKSLENNTDLFLKSANEVARGNKLRINEKELLRDVGKLSNVIKLSLGSSAENIAKATTTAKSLGLELSKVSSIANSLLNIEDSLSSEMEAELLTGKELNLERAREAALANDLTTLSEEIAKNVGTAAEFGKMNRIQQEAYSKSLGMSTDDIADMLVKKEALSAISENEYNMMRKTMSAEEISAAIKSGGIDSLMQQQSVQERLNDSLEKMKEILVPIGSLLLTILEPVLLILDGINWVYTKFSELGSYIGGNLLGNFGKFGKGVITTIAALTAAAAYFGTMLFSAPLGPFAIPLALAAGAAAFTTINSMGSKMKDGIVSPDGGMVLSGEKGSIQLDKDDSVIAGTSLFGNKKSNKDTTQQSNNIDISQITNELVQIKKVLNNILNKDTNISIDGVALSKQLGVISTYKS